MTSAVCILLSLSCATIAAAEDKLQVGRSLAGDLASGASHSYTLALKSGDYAAGSITQSTATNLTIFLPSGSQLREFPGLPQEGTRQFAFAAEGAGTYRIELTAPGPQGVRYELRLNQVLTLDERMKSAARQNEYSSPRIETLRKLLESGQTSTEAFWKQVTRDGTPLVEPVDNDKKYQLVTFLFRGTSYTRNVLVLGSFRTLPFLNYTMIQLVGSDVWHLTLKLPSGARFSYQLSPNDPLTDPGSLDGGPRAAQRLATAQIDPLNLHPLEDSIYCPPARSKFECPSTAELPGVPTQPWIVKNTGTPQGRIEKHRIKSALLGNERDISVYTPPGYRADTSPYALLILFDDFAYLSFVPAPVTLDNLIAASKIPPTVAVLIANPSDESRARELSPNPDFADFLARELIPWAHAHYNVTRDPRRTVVGGLSLGGIAATYAGLRHSEIFGNVLCQSGPFWWAPNHVPGPDFDASNETGWLAKEFIRSPKLPLKFYIDAGTFEVDSGATGGSILETSRHMRDVLLAKGYEVKYQQFVGGHDYLSWRGTLADGLIALIGTK